MIENTEIIIPVPVQVIISYHGRGRGEVIIDREAGKMKLVEILSEASRYYHSIDGWIGEINELENWSVEFRYD